MKRFIIECPSWCSTDHASEGAKYHDSEVGTVAGVYVGITQEAADGRGRVLIGGADPLRLDGDAARRVAGLLCRAAELVEHAAVEGVA